MYQYAISCAFYFRNIGFGFCSVLARVGAAVAPQLVFLVSS